MTDRSNHPIVHFVGSIPLSDSETVFRTLSKAVGPHLVRLPDGETGNQFPFNRQAGNREILDRSLGLCPPLCLSRDLDLAHRIFLDAELLIGHLCDCS